MPFGNAHSLLPRQAVKQTYLAASASTPRTAPTFFATSGPPAVHPFTGAFPAAQAAAKPSQPGYPHPPQFAPGKQSRIFATVSSTGTKNNFLKNPNKIPKTKAITAETKSVNKIVFISFLYLLCCLI